MEKRAFHDPSPQEAFEVDLNPEKPKFDTSLRADRTKLPKTEPDEKHKIIGRETVKEAAKKTANLAEQLRQGEEVAMAEKKASFIEVAKTLFEDAPELDTIDWIAESRPDIVNLYANLVEANETITALKKISENVKHFTPFVEAQAARKVIQDMNKPAAPTAPTRVPKHLSRKPAIDRTKNSTLDKIKGWFKKDAA